MTTRLRGRPAHAPGPTFLSYTPNGKKLVTAGLNGALRVFQHASDDEPVTIDVLSENHTAVAASNEFFIVGTEDAATKYSLVTNSLQEVLVRTSLPIRDVAISPDGQWAAIGGDELEVKVVNTRDLSRVTFLREQLRPVKNVSFDISGSLIAVSCTDGIIYVYSLSSEHPQLLKRVDGIIKRLEGDAEASAKVCWHPDGRAFVAPTPARDLQVVSRTNWQNQKSFKSGHDADITAVAWSPNGAVLASAAIDKSLVLWDTRTQKILKRYDNVQDTILAMQWHPTDNVLSYTNNNGELFIRDKFVPEEHLHLLRVELQPAPFNNEPLNEVSNNIQKQVRGHEKSLGLVGDVDRDDDGQWVERWLDDDLSEDGAGFVEDDDGQGYAEVRNLHGKRMVDGLDGRKSKRRAMHTSWEPQIHAPIQPGSTPWKGNRRYLCLNLIGFVWTVDQGTHNTVTVEFYNRQDHRDFHFTDPFIYDKACLTEKGALFSCPASDQHPAIVEYRPHETWTTRTNSRIQLPAGEEVISLSLSETCIVATTSSGYVRSFSLFGTPLGIYRQKSIPAITCASWRDYVMTVGNGPVGGNGLTKLLYTIHNVKRDEVCQSEDCLPLSDGTTLRALFFSDKGDPCVYDSDGVLLILQHWRSPGQARWVPLLDTRQLERLAGGKITEDYWPVAVAGNRFHCIILKGGEQYPYFPRPLLSDFEFRIPLSASPGVGEQADDEAVRQRDLEEQYVRCTLQHSLLQDLVENTNATHAQRAEIPQIELEADKVLLQLLANECREGEERGMKALEIAALMRDRTGKMLEAAQKVAARFQRDLLREKISVLAERRLVGLVDETEM